MTSERLKIKKVNQVRHQKERNALMNSINRKTRKSNPVKFGKIAKRIKAP
jgi:hypothetical protein